jgi:hypothetical protein
VKNGEMMLSEYGKIAKTCRLDLPKHYRNCILDMYVIMPDHMHGIISIVGDGFKPSLTPEADTMDMGEKPSLTPEADTMDMGEKPSLTPEADTMDMETDKPSVRDGFQPYQDTMDMGEKKH